MLKQTTSRIIRRAFHASRQARQADDAGASGALKLTFALPHQAIMSDATVSFFLIFRATENVDILSCLFFGVSNFKSLIFTYIYIG